MVHHSCYLNISLEADRLLFFLVLGRLPFALSCTPWRVLGALTQELRNSRSAETFVAECFPDFHVASQHDLQAQGTPSGMGRAFFRLVVAGFGWSWLRFRIWENHIQARNRRCLCECFFKPFAARKIDKNRCVQKPQKPGASFTYSCLRLNNTEQKTVKLANSPGKCAKITLQSW